jgi:HptB-dependent secretion and biofilm anti anti-sigma factor
MSDSQLISLPSRFDYGYHKPFYDACTEYLNKDEINEIILDFTHVEYMDSSALGMLVMIHKKTSNAMKKVKIKGARGATDEILKMANIQKIIEFI